MMHTPLPPDAAAAGLVARRFAPIHRGKGKRAEKSDFRSSIVTEDSAAQEFAARYSARLRYCHSTRAWFEWDGVRWCQNMTGRAFQLARELARELAAADKIHYVTSKTSFADGVERFARSDDAFAVTSEWWDASPFLLGTPGGTVELTTGELRASDPSDGI